MTDLRLLPRWLHECVLHVQQHVVVQRCMLLRLARRSAGRSGRSGRLQRLERRTRRLELEGRMRSSWLRQLPGQSTRDA